MRILEDKLAADNPVEITDSKAATEQGGDKPSSSAEPDLTDGKEPSPEITEPSPEKTGQEDALADTGKEESAKPWYEQEGFKSEADAVKSYKELRAMDTRLSQEKTEMEKRMAGYEATLQKLSEFFQEPTREDTENPEITDLNEKIVNTPVFKEIATFLGEIAEEKKRTHLSTELNSFKQTHQDYAEYEKSMADLLGKMDEKSQGWLMNHPGGYTAAIEFLYNQAKVMNFSSDVEKKKALAAAEKAKVEAQNKGNMNLLGEAIDPSVYGGGNISNPDKDVPFDGSIRWFTD